MAIAKPRSVAELRQNLARISELRGFIAPRQAEYDRAKIVFDSTFQDLLDARAELKERESNAVEFAERCHSATFGSAPSITVGAATLSARLSPGALEYPTGRAAIARELAARAGIDPARLLAGSLDGAQLADVLRIDVDVNAQILLSKVKAGIVPAEQLAKWGIQFVKPVKVSIA